MSSTAESNLVHEAYELNVPPLVLSGASGEGSLFEVDSPNTIVETVKLAEDGSGDIVARMYEASRTATSCVLRTCLPVKKVAETNMLEIASRSVACRKGEIALDFRPFEIKTLRLKT